MTSLLTKRSATVLLHGSSTAARVAIFGNDTGHPVQSERPARSPAEIVDLDGERHVVSAEASSGDRLCVEEGPSFMYGRESRQLQTLTRWAKKRRSCRPPRYRLQKRRKDLDAY